MITLCCVLVVLLVLLVLVVLLVLSFFDKQVLLDYAVGEYFSGKNNIERMVDVDVGVSKKKVVNFYKGSPQRGCYINYLKKIEKEAFRFLSKPLFKNLIGKTVVMDVDDTLVWTRPYNPIMKNRERKGSFGSVVHYDALPPMVSLAKKIQKMGYHLIIVTARGPHMLYDTVTNLNSFGLYPEKVFTSLYYGQDQRFKEVMRKNMEKTDMVSLQGMSNEDLFSGKFKDSRSPLRMKVIMTIGDRWQDVGGQENTLGLKLPDPRDRNAYFLYNNEVRII